jgi:hypothetical protein
MPVDSASRTAHDVADDVWVQLATRIPKDLHRQMKLHCVRTDESVMGFVVKAISEQLERETGNSPGPVKMPRRAGRA